MKRNVQGFTLVELLIVAVVLAIFAAIVVPQFASTTDEAKESALKTDLAAMRSAIDLYRQQHSAYPGASASSGGTCTGGTAGSGAAGSAAAFADQLTRYSNAAGQTCTVKLAAFPVGPYIRDDSIPADAVGNSNTVVIATTDSTDLLMGATASAAGGWKFSTDTGKLVVNIDANDSKGVAYDTY